MNRRDFLLASQKHLLTYLGGSILSQLPMSRAIASLTESEPHFFILLKVVGGMDVTLGLDPKTHSNGTDQKDIFIEYRPEDIVRAGNLQLGPAAASLRQHYQDIAIVNGINMKRDTGHLASIDYISTGGAEGKTAIFPIEIGVSSGMSPFGIMIDGPVPRGNRKPILSLSSQFVTDKTFEIDSKDLLNSLNLKDLGSSFSKAQLGLVDAIGPLSHMNSLLNSHREKYGPGSVDKFLAAAFSFISGLCSQASLEISLPGSNNGLDSHANHEGRHLGTQTAIWEEVSNIFSVFKGLEFLGSSLFDYTTFMLVSEFSRTPSLNGSEGKDHNPYTNSTLFAGKNIVGNSVVGASHIVKKNQSPTGDSLHISSPIDFKTGSIITNLSKKTKDVNIIYPENIARTVASIFADPQGFSSVDLSTTRSIPGLLKT